MFRYISQLTFLLCLTLTSLQAGLVNGPMLAHLEMREARIWVQTDIPSVVRVAYANVDTPDALFWTPAVETDPESAHTAVAQLDLVEPNQTYSYRVEINGDLVGLPAEFTSPEFYQGRTPPPDFKIAVGGAHYALEEGFEPPYQILGSGYEIFNTIAESEPALMIWAGNTVHLRESDWYTKSGYLKRYTRARAIPEMASLLQNIPQYATWSDHDFSAPNGGHQTTQRAIAEASFETFWPRPMEVTQLEGVATQFRYADVDFFMLDVRSYRNDTPHGNASMEILGKAQIDWLRQALIRSSATFKIVIAGAPILNPADSRSNLSYAEGEHTNLLHMFNEEGIAGLFFISGGKDYGELTRLVQANNYSLYDLTVGPMTANPKDNQDELNFFRVPGSSSFERHFAIIEFTGSEEERELTIRVMSMEGKELWNRTIPASLLQPK